MSNQERGPGNALPVDSGTSVHHAARAVSAAALLFALASVSLLAQSPQGQSGRLNTVTTSPLAGFPAPLFEAMLYHSPLGPFYRLPDSGCLGICREFVHSPNWLIGEHPRLGGRLP